MVRDDTYKGEGDFGQQFSSSWKETNESALPPNFFDLNLTWFLHLLREAIVQKIPEFMKYFHKTVPPPPYCFCEILIQIFPLILR